MSDCEGGGYSSDDGAPKVQPEGATPVDFGTPAEPMQSSSAPEKLKPDSAKWASGVLTPDIDLVSSEQVFASMDFWAQPVREYAAKHMKGRGPRPMRLVCACVGLGSEGMVMKAVEARQSRFAFDTLSRQCF
jgi:hypothetical protein